MAFTDECSSLIEMHDRLMTEVNHLNSTIWMRGLISIIADLYQTAVQRFEFENRAYLEPDRCASIYVYCVYTVVAWCMYFERSYKSCLCCYSVDR